MKEIIVTTQSKLDALPAKFDEFTIIKIDSKKTWLTVKTARETPTSWQQRSFRPLTHGFDHVRSNHETRTTEAGGPGTHAK